MIRRSWRTDADKESATEANDLPDDDCTVGEVPPGPFDRRKFFVRIPWARVVTYGVVPAVIVMLAAAAGWLKWQDRVEQMAIPAGVQAVQAASDSVIAMLSYQPDSVEKDLAAARDRLTGDFRNSYTSLTRDVVIPAARQDKISSLANVPAAAVVSSTDIHVVVLLSVNQTVTIGTEKPTTSTSSVRVTLDKIGDQWLISDFTPV